MLREKIDLVLELAEGYLGEAPPAYMDAQGDAEQIIIDEVREALLIIQEDRKGQLIISTRVYAPTLSHFPEMLCQCCCENKSGGTMEVRMKNGFHTYSLCQRCYYEKRYEKFRDEVKA